MTARTESETLVEFKKLGRTTAECDEGPEVSMRPGLLFVRYDTETDAGRVWTTLRFEGAVALRVLPEVSVSETAARAYSLVGIVNNSAWSASLAGGRGDGCLPVDLKHYVVFFDHYGSIETIARSCEVQE